MVAARARYRYYTCWTRARLGPGECAADRLPADALEDSANAALHRAFADKETVVLALRKAFSKVAQESPDYEAQLVQVAAQIAKTEESIERYLLAFENRTMPEAPCGKRIEALTEQAKELRRHQEDLSEAAAEAGSETDMMPDMATIDTSLGQLLDGDDTDVRERKAIVQKLIADIRVESRDHIIPTFRVAPSYPGSHCERTGTPYRIRTDDLRLERAVSWATRRTGQAREIIESRREAFASKGVPREGVCMGSVAESPREGQITAAKTVPTELVDRLHRASVASTVVSGTPEPALHITRRRRVLAPSQCLPDRGARQVRFSRGTVEHIRTDDELAALLVREQMYTSLNLDALQMIGMLEIVAAGLAIFTGAVALGHAGGWTDPIIFATAVAALRVVGGVVGRLIEGRVDERATRALMRANPEMGSVGGEGDRLLISALRQLGPQWMDELPLAAQRVIGWLIGTAPWLMREAAIRTVGDQLRGQTALE